MEINITRDEDTGRVIEAFVKSESQEGVFYRVEAKIFGSDEQWKCTCHAGQNGRKCQHVKAVKEEVGL